MSRISNCVACNAKKNGVKTRIAIPHTCGGDKMSKENLIEPNAGGRQFIPEGKMGECDGVSCEIMGGCEVAWCLNCCWVDDVGCPVDF